MSLASETRRAVDEHPFLVGALGAGVVNYTAAARYLDVDGDTDAVATAIRRYAEELSTAPDDARKRDVRVRMESGIELVSGGRARSDVALLAVGGTSFRPDGGELTAIVVTGDVGTTELATALQRLSIEDVDPVAAGVSDGTIMIVVERLDGADAVRTVESTLEPVPETDSS